jgi:hypothetical protein
MAKLFARDQAKARSHLLFDGREPNQCFKTISAFITHPDVTDVTSVETFRTFRRHQ